MRPMIFSICMLLFVYCQPLTAKSVEKKELVEITPKLAVLDFEFQGIFESGAEEYVDFIADSVRDIKDYQVIDRKLVRLVEQSIAAGTGEPQIPPEKRRLDFGRAVAAHQIVAGRLVNEDESYTIDMHLIEVQSGKIINGVSKQYASMSDLYGDGENLLRCLLTPPIRLRYYLDTSNSVYSFEGQDYPDTNLLLNALEQKGNLTEEMKREILNFRIRYGFGVLLNVIGVVLYIPGLLILAVLASPGQIHDPQSIPIGLAIGGGSVIVGGIIAAIGINMKTAPNKVFELYNRQRTIERISPAAQE